MSDRFGPRNANYPTTSYGCDGLGNLRTVSIPVGMSQMRIEYVVDGQNRRVGKKNCAAPCDHGDPAVLQQGFLYRTACASST